MYITNSFFSDMGPYIKSVVDSYTKSEQLEEFAYSWSLEEEPYIQERIFQLKCKELFDLIDQDVIDSIT